MPNDNDELITLRLPKSVCEFFTKTADNLTEEDPQSIAVRGLIDLIRYAMRHKTVTIEPFDMPPEPTHEHDEEDYRLFETEVIDLIDANLRTD